MSPCTDARCYPRFRSLQVLPAAVAAIAFVLSGCGDSNDTSSQEPAGLLFAQTATRGTLHRGAGQSTLTLNGIYPSVTAFSDRPERSALQIPNASFAQLWQQPTFRKDPPNAALVISGAPASGDVFVLELRKPKLGRRSISYQATSVTNSGMTSLDQRGDPARKAPTSFRDASLLIDDVPAGSAQTAVSQAIEGQVTDLPGEVPQGAPAGLQRTVTELSSQAQQLANASPRQAITLGNRMLDETQAGMTQLAQAGSLSQTQQNLAQTLLDIEEALSAYVRLAQTEAQIALQGGDQQAQQGSTGPALTETQPGQGSTGGALTQPDPGN